MTRKLQVLADRDALVDYDFVDAILQFRPAFTHSLPVQILVTSIICTLLFVLFLHLLLTARYHYLLAPVNFALQLVAVTCLLISHLVSLAVVLREALLQSHEWPYMLAYIAVTVPPSSESANAWSTAMLAAWCTLKLVMSALIQITHIQLLTLLFPTKFETRLIFFLLGPLALLSALTQLQPLLPSSWAHIIIAVHTTCNATLSLIYTSALLAWGTVVAPRRAWRSDGGTSAFGAGALVLALVSTALSFVCIPAAGKSPTFTSPQCVWIPGLVLSVILWQSYLGWWWWVGAISGGLEEAEKRKKRAKAEKGQKKSPRIVGMGTGRRGTSAAPTPRGEARTDPPEGISVQHSTPNPPHGTVLRWWVSLHRRRRAED